MRVVVDGRPTQAGFRRHKHRGTGKIAEMLLRHLPAAAPDLEIGVLLDRSKPVEPFLFARRYRLFVHGVPGLFSLNEEIADTHLYLPFTLDSAHADAVHFLAHVDVPAVHVHRNAIVTVLDVIPLIFPELYRPERNVLYKVYQRLLKRIVHRARIVMTISEHSKRDIVRIFGIAEDRVRVVRLGVDSIFQRKTDADRNRSVCEKYGIRRPFLFYVGGIDPRKNIGRLVQAFDEFCRRSRGTVDLVLAGDVKDEPEFPGIERSIHRFGLEDRVRWIGYVPLEDLPNLYGSADAFVFPSLYEGFGFPPLEAMACGTPVVSSNASSMPEVVGDSGLLVDPSNVHEMAGALLELRGNPELRRRLVEKGLRRAKQFDWKNTAVETASLYREILRGTAP